MATADLVPHRASFAELDAATLYGLLKLRCDVFVVEQRCAYEELDGRDTEPGTRHLWLAAPASAAPAPAAPLAYLRVLVEPDATRRIGRVCTAPTARGAGLSGRLVAAALADPDVAGPAASYVLSAQSQLAPFYARFGFRVSGPEFVEDGIAHTPMRRAAGSFYSQR